MQQQCPVRRGTALDTTALGEMSVVGGVGGVGVVGDGRGEQQRFSTPPKLIFGDWRSMALGAPSGSGRSEIGAPSYGTAFVGGRWMERVKK